MAYTLKPKNHGESQCYEDGKGIYPPFYPLLHFLVFLRGTVLVLSFSRHALSVAFCPTIELTISRTSRAYSASKQRDGYCGPMLSAGCGLLFGKSGNTPEAPG